MLFAIFCFVSILIAVVSLKLTAARLTVAKSDWLSCLIATILSIVICTAISHIVTNKILIILTSVGAVCLLLESVLDTNLRHAILLAFVIVVVLFIVEYGFRHAGYSTDLVQFFTK